jgi:branched-chain amino acid transport system ATP-binding protein
MPGVSASATKALNQYGLFLKTSMKNDNRQLGGASPAVILETRHLTKEFKGFTAVNDVSLRVQRGHIHALIGPNGAGKTTCFNLLTKFLVPTSGQILFNNRDITSEASAQIARKGIIRSFQISAVFPRLTVLENVRIGLQRELGTAFHFWKSERTLTHLNERAMELLAQVDLKQFADTVTVDLPYGHKRALEIAATLAMEPELMLLDEPTQGMGHEDVSRVTELIKRVSRGRTILMVEHNMSVVAGICDRISVLQRGAVLAEGSYDEVSCDPQVMEAYMGTTGALEGAH